MRRTYAGTWGTLKIQSILWVDSLYHIRGIAMSNGNKQNLMQVDFIECVPFDLGEFKPFITSASTWCRSNDLVISIITLNYQSSLVAIVFVLKSMTFCVVGKQRHKILQFLHKILSRWHFMCLRVYNMHMTSTNRQNKVSGSPFRNIHLVMSLSQFQENNFSEVSPFCF